MTQTTRHPPGPLAANGTGPNVNSHPATLNPAKPGRDPACQWCRLTCDPQSAPARGTPGSESELVWSDPAEAPMPGSAEVHLWRADLDQRDADISGSIALLSGEERARAARYRQARDRRHFIIRRALLRTILSRYLDTDPARLRFGYGVCGKPGLAGDDPSIQFNLSHSEGLALYAVTRQTPIGVDVERVRVIPEAEQIGVRYFSAHEMAAWRALPGGSRAEAFLRLWTRKEASLKLSGRGLSGMAGQFPLAGDGKALDAARIWPRLSSPSTRCVLLDLTPAAGCVGALALAAPRVADVYPGMGL